MAKQMLGNPSQHNIVRNPINICIPEDPQHSGCKWYFNREEIEDCSPSRKDGIELEKESHIRKSYCSFLQKLGMKLQVPQVTIACAMMLCHRFYMRQSHAKNDWQTIATVSMFLACKIEDTPRYLRDVVVVSYEITYEWDPSAPQRIRQREVYDKQKELILIGERLLLATIAFELDIQLPYKPLVAALKRLDTLPDLAKAAWNFVNDWLRTSLCLQYKPHYIAAGSVFLAAMFQKVELPTGNGKDWWLEFDISPKQLKEVIRQMYRHLELDRKRAQPATHGKVTSTDLAGKAISTSPQSCISGESVANSHSSDGAVVETGGFSKSLAAADGHFCAKEVLPCQTSHICSGSVVEDGSSENLRREVQPDPNSSFKIVLVHNTISEIDASRIRETMKRRRCDRATNRGFSEAINVAVDSEAWIERELENGVVVESASSVKKQREIF